MPRFHIELVGLEAVLNSKQVQFTVSHCLNHECIRIYTDTGPERMLYTAIKCMTTEVDSTRILTCVPHIEWEMFGM